MLKSLAVIATLAAVASAQDPEIVATQDGIIFLMKNNQKIGYKLGNGTNVYFSDMPDQWQQYTNTMFSVMKNGFDMGVATAGVGGAAAGCTGDFNRDKALGLPDMPDLSWNEIERRATGGSVNFWMWNGAGANRWVVGWLAKRMMQKFSIKVNIGTGVPGAMGDYAAPQAVTQVEKELNTNPTDGGSVDLVWINGQNFKNLKPNAYGPWTWKIPSGRHYKWNAQEILYDFGTPTEGKEMPYNTAQFVFFYNTIQVDSAPKNIPQLVTWIKANPGRFTYANPTSDFLGAATLRHFFYAYAGPYTDFLTSDDGYTQRAKAVWAVLKDIESSLATVSADGGQQTYPSSHDAVRDAFASGDIWIDGAYDPNHASSQILNGVYSNDTKSFVMDDGSISNLNFVAIPKNAANKYAALVTANVIASVEGVFSRTQPERWGTLPALDVLSDAMVESGWDTAFDYIASHHAVPSVEDLERTRVAELSSAFQERIHNDWKKCVLEKSTSSDCV